MPREYREELLRVNDAEITRTLILGEWNRTLWKTAAMLSSVSTIVRFDNKARQRIRVMGNRRWPSSDKAVPARMRTETRCDPPGFSRMRILEVRAAG